MSHMDPDAGAYIPTAEEIAAHCLRIQATWSPQERKRRTGWRAENHQLDTPFIHEVKLSDMYGALASFASDASALRDYAHKCE